MKKFKVTYQLSGLSTQQQDDIIVPAESEEDAKVVFEKHYPEFFFVSAKEGLY